jgi:hypothetical protein
MSFDSFVYINETLDLVAKASEKSIGNQSYSYMLGYFQSHMKGIFDSLYTTLTPEQKAILEMELDALKRRVEYKS